MVILIIDSKVLTLNIKRKSYIVNNICAIVTIICISYYDVFKYMDHVLSN